MTIDRAIEILNPEHRENYDGMDEVNEACRMGMEALERTRWIPCSERLPERNGYYLTVDKPENVGAYVNVHKFSAGTFHGFFPITHWMPLPKPPEEGVNENAAD